MIVEASVAKVAYLANMKNQGCSQGIFTRQRPRQNFQGKGRGKASKAKTKASQDQDRGRDTETEARQSDAKARPRSRQDEPRHLKPIIIVTTVLLPCKN